MSVLLSINNLAVSYGHIEAIKGVDLNLNAGEITALVGANGAGKTTTLLVLSGMIKTVRGQISFQGADLIKLAPHEIVKRGIVQVAEGRAILTTLTVNENLQLGAYTRRDKIQVRRDLDWILSLFPILYERADSLAGNLSGGEQQMLAIGRALMAKPKLLLLDEPSMGLAPLIVRDIFSIIKKINQAGISILLVEQNVKQALKIADYAYVLETGKTVLEGKAKNLINDPRVISAYLGV
jgi:branched-chain amino acid transport system ATP-binding protein